MLATQIEVSDGTLNAINVGIEFFDQSDISVSLDQSGTPLVLGTDYQWTNATTIQFLSSVSVPGGLVPAGVEVVIRRSTQINAMFNILDGGAPFSRLTLDENYEQLLFLSQEYREGLGLDGLRNNLNMNGYRVVNVGNPVNPGDATNKAYVDGTNQRNLRTPEIIPALPAASARANKVLGFNSSGEPIATLPATGSGTELAIDLASTEAGKGASLVGIQGGGTMQGIASTVQAIVQAGSNMGAALVGFLQAGANAVGRTAQDKMRERVTIQDFGGNDNGLVESTTPFNSGRDVVGPKGRLRLPFKTSGTYRFFNSIDINNVVIDNDKDVTLSAPEYLLNISSTGATKVMNKLRLYFNNINFSHYLYPEHSEDLAEKRVWLSEGAFDYSYREALALTGLRNEKLLWPNADTWQAASNGLPQGTGTDSPYMYWSAGAPVTWHQSSMAVREGDDLSAAFDTGGVYNRGCFIRFVTGYHCLYGTGTNGGLKFVQKLTGVAPVENDVGVGDVFRSQKQYFAEGAVWRVRVISKRQYIILLNGVQVGGVLTAPSTILRVGFGYMPQAVDTISVSGFTRTRNAKAGGRPAETITIYGDSMSADIHGGWPYFMRKALEGVAGTTVGSVTNLAVPGYSTSDMWRDMQVKGLNGGTTVLCGSTNDIQGQSGVNLMLSNMRSMIQYALDRAQLVVVWIPPMWYTRAEAMAAGAPANTGQDSANPQFGASYRVALERLCATMQVKCVDMTQVSGTINAEYLVPQPGIIADSGLRDNIHATAYMYKKLGVAIAAAILGERSGGVNRRREREPLAITMNAGVTNDPLTPAMMFISQDGMLQGGGKLNTVANPAMTNPILGVLREDLVPVMGSYTVPVTTDKGNCWLTVNDVGQVSLTNYAINATWVDLGAIHMLTNY